MPTQTDGAMFGFQLWINLPAAEKMRDPWYADIPAEAIPQFTSGDAKVKLIAGEWDGHKGPAPERTTATFFADVTLPAGASLDIPVPKGHAGFVYVFEGDLRVEGKSVRNGELGVLSDGRTLRVADGSAGARFLVVAGKALHEPVARYGPFVMNSVDEIRTAMEDYNAGRF
jgi:hypothetical protein